MKKHFGASMFVVCCVLFSISSVGALEPPEKCAVKKLNAAAKLFRCLVNAQIKTIKKGLSDQERVMRVEECEGKQIKKFEQAQTRALDKDSECPSVGDAQDVAADLDFAVQALGVQPIP